MDDLQDDNREPDDPVEFARWHLAGDITLTDPDRAVDGLMRLMTAHASTGNDVMRTVTLRHLIARGTRSPAARLQLDRLADRMLRSRHPIPGQLRHWIADRLAGKVKRPRVNAKGERHTDMMVVALVEALCRRFGMTPTINPATDPAVRKSACHVIAEVMPGMDMHNAAKIWDRTAPAELRNELRT